MTTAQVIIFSAACIAVLAMLIERDRLAGVILLLTLVFGTSHAFAGLFG